MPKSIGRTKKRKFYGNRYTTNSNKRRAINKKIEDKEEDEPIVKVEMESFVEDSNYSPSFQERTLQPSYHTEDEPIVKIEVDSSVEDSSFEETTFLPSASTKRTRESSEDSNLVSNKRHQSDDRTNDVIADDNYENHTYCSLDEMGEDYHFLMSVLPSVRRFRQDRKTSFKMKVLQLIMDEENAESSERI